MTFAPDDIEIKEFVPTMRGYDRTEVRAFLRAVAEDVRRLEDRLTERALLALKAETVPEPADRLDPPTNSRLEDAIRDLTVAVQRLNTREIGPLAISQMSSESTVPRLASEPILAPKVTTSETHKSTWDGAERRSASRPWSGSSAGTPTTASKPDERMNSSNSRAEKRTKHVPQHARSRENQSLISTFLNQALDHRAKPISSTDAPVDDLVRKQLPEVTKFAPAAKLPTELPTKLRTNEPESDVPTNVVPLMRAV
jgi:DivIVA domain-containing protein